MQSEEIRKRFIEFFKARGHAVIPSAPLVPIGGDASVLFTTAGMQPLVPYLLGEKHPAGARLVNVQKCVRTQDIEEVGDNTHDTFFEMLGNWSLGSYWKKETIEWSYDLLTNKKTGFGLDPNRLYVTCFEGDENALRDEESATIWKEIFTKNKIEGERIYFLGASKNWWSAGANGPCGPDTEMFYDLTGELTKGLTKEEYLKANDEQRVVEIWNDVFMEYEKREGKVIGKLSQQNVDTGAGLERLAMVLQKVDNVFATDLFAGIMKVIDDNTPEDRPQDIRGRSSETLRAKRIVADHLRTSVMMLADGVLPSNTDRGYVLRRLLRRAVRYADLIKLAPDGFVKIIDEVIGKYAEVYPEVLANKDNLPDGKAGIKSEIENEEQKFRKTLRAGLAKLSKVISYNINTSDPILREKISGKEAFDLYQTHGFPVELIIEEAARNNLRVDEDEFKKLLTEHQALSRAGAEQKFKGGLADHSPETIKLHTAHHLILAALKLVLGKEVKQRGSNITSERLRIDFSFARKLTPEELAEVEKIVNEKIKENLKVERREMPKAEAEKLGAEMEFGAKYGETVSVYLIGDPDARSGRAFSSEFCGGPHVSSTGEIGGVKIIKEEAVASGVRRIKATLV